MMTQMKVLLFVCFLVFSLSTFAQTERTLAFGQNIFSYFSNISVEEKNEDIEKMIISVHGSERNAVTYYNTMNALVKKMGGEKTTFVMAPHFKNAEDTLLQNEINFDDEAWLRGDKALNASISSFEVIDQFISLASINFPKLREVTLIGHSAGGQYTQRYALGSLLENELSQVKFRYIVTNPGSYAYPTAKRLIKGTFAVPQNPACAYNDYKFGLENLNSYLGRSSVEEIQKRYASRHVYYLLGELDNANNVNGTPTPDQSCEAMLQGPGRLERGQIFKAMMDSEYPQNKHGIFTVPNTAHTQWGMYNSPVGSKLIFELP